MDEQKVAHWEPTDEELAAEIVRRMPQFAQDYEYLEDEDNDTLDKCGLWVGVSFPEYNMAGFFMSWGREDWGYKTGEVRPTIREAMIEGLAEMGRTHAQAEARRAERTARAQA